MGQRDEALNYARQAESLYRELAQHNPQAFRPVWATSLGTLANMLSEVGQRDEALACARQAEALHRELALHNPQAFRPDWAMSLGTLANMLREVGQRDEALACARQAEALHRELALHNPQAFRPVWATSLNNLANRLSEVGQRDEALGCTRQAESIFRELDQHNPQAFRHYWAASLYNLSIVLGHAGERAAALSAAEKALNLYEQLAKQWPDAFAENVKTTQQLYQALGGLVIQLQRPALPVHYGAASFPTLTTLPSPTPRWTSGVVTMLDLAAITALASTAVTLLTPLLEKIAEGGAQELGTSAIKELVDKFKRRFSQPKTQEALDDLAQQPTDADAQAVLRQALKKAMSADPSLAAALQQWIQDAQPQAATQPGIQQTINASGNHNKNVQIVGSGNSVS